MRKNILIAIFALLAIGVLALWFLHRQRQRILATPIKVGILHSLTGTMAISERHVANTTMMAVDEINENGGILGRKLEAVLVDAKSDWPTFAKEAEKLITKDQVSVIFGCWTSASRKNIKPIIEKNQHLLFYPVQYEGLEESPNIIYTGDAPNQQIIPAVKWCVKHFGKRIFLIGSDYVFPHAANAIIKEEAKVLGAEIVGEEYLLLGETDTKAVVNKIIAKNPDIILNTINGGTNREFFRQLFENGISAENIPVMSFSLAEKELEVIGARMAEGHFACWSYFQSIDSPENREFVKKCKSQLGSHCSISDPMEAGYFGVHLWAKAVEKAGSVQVKDVLPQLKGVSYNAPEGLVTIDRNNNHTWRKCRIGKIKSNGQFEIVWSSDKDIEPLPFPKYKSKAAWSKMLEAMHSSWGGKWANSGNAE